MGHPKLRLLYTTPETLFGKQYEADFRRCHRQKQIVRLVIDEVSGPPPPPARFPPGNTEARLMDDQAHVIDVSSCQPQLSRTMSLLTCTGLGLGIPACQ